MGHQLRKEIIWIVPKKFQKLLRQLALLMFLICVQAFHDPLCRELSMSTSSWMMDPTCSREMSNCSAIDLSEIRPSSKISSWVWSIISGVVTVLGHPGQGTSQVEKSPRLNWGTQFLMVAYDFACSPNVSLRMAWISYGALPCRKKKNLMTACVSILLKSHALRDMLPFSLSNKKRLQFSTWTEPSFHWHYRIRPTTSGNRSGYGLISTSSYLSLALGFAWHTCSCDRCWGVKLGNKWDRCDIFHHAVYTYIKCS